MIKTLCISSHDDLLRNRKYSASLGLVGLADLPEKATPLAVVGGGGAARDCLDEILNFPGHVMAINGAYDWLMDQGRVADYVLALDPQSVMKDFYRRASHLTTFLVATCCAPDVFATLRGFRVITFDAPQGDETGDIPGGNTAMSRSPIVGAVLGYRDITLYGADSCYDTDNSHVYGGEIVDPITVFCGREWRTTWGLLAQAEYLAAMLPAVPLKIKIAGDNLAAALLGKGHWSLVE